jgi:hypothetical protein
MTGDMGMGGNKIIDVDQVPTADGDATAKKYVDDQDALRLPLDGSSAMTGSLDLGSNRAVNAADPVDPQDLVTKQYFDDNNGAGGSFVTKTNAEVSSIPVGSVVYADSTTDEVQRSLADNIDTVKGTIGVALEEITAAGSGRIQLVGEVTVVTDGALVPGELCYISDSVAGAVTTTAPTAIGSVNFVIGVAVSTTRIVLIPSFRFENENTYEETLAVVSGAPADDNEITGPVTSGSLLTLPLDSRNLNNARSYRNGSGDLELYLNGQKLELSDDWSEVGAVGTLQTQVVIDRDLVVGDEIVFRDAARTTNLTATGGAGANELNDLIDVTITSPLDGHRIKYDGGSNQWINELDESIETVSNVGTGAGQVFKQKTGSDAEFKTIQSGSGILVTNNADEVTVSLDPNGNQFRQDIDDQPGVTIISNLEFNMHTNTLDLYRNGVLMIVSPFMNDQVGRYMEVTRNSVVLDPGPDNALIPAVDDVFSFVSKPNSPDYKVIITGKTGTVISVPAYTLATNELQVFRNGVLMNDQGLGSADVQYSETSTTSITLGLAAVSDDIFVIIKGADYSSREDRDGETGTFISGVPTYTPGSGDLLVYKNGVLMFDSTTLGSSSDRYQETSSTSITLEEAAIATDVLTFVVK